MIHFSIEDGSEIGWLKVTFNAATENSFEVKIPDKYPKQFDSGYSYLFRQLFHIVPMMISLDGDFMESADGADVKISNYKVEAVKRFAEEHAFRDVYCALPGFEYK